MVTTTQTWRAELERAACNDHIHSHVRVAIRDALAFVDAAATDGTGLRRALANITAARDAAERAGDGHIREGLDEALDLVRGELAGADEPCEGDGARTDMAADALRVLRGAAAAPNARPYLTAEQGRHLAAEFDRLHAELSASREREAQVLELHRPVDGPLDADDNRIKVCDHCIDGWEGQYEYPCPTVQAVRGDAPTGFGGGDESSDTPRVSQTAAPAAAPTDAGDDPGVSDSPVEVWIPPADDCMNSQHDPPCPHCGSRLFHLRTGRCGECGRRPAAAPTDGQAPAGDTAALCRCGHPGGRHDDRRGCSATGCRCPLGSYSRLVTGPDGRRWRRAADGRWTQRINDAIGVFTDVEMLDVLARTAPADDTAAPDPMADVLLDARAVVRHLAEARRTGEDGDWARLARVIDTLSASLDGVAAARPARDTDGGDA